MFSKLFSLLGSMLVFLLMGYLCYPFFAPKGGELAKRDRPGLKPAHLIVKASDDMVKPDMQIDDTVKPDAIVDVTPVDDETDSVLNTWGVGEVEQGDLMTDNTQDIDDTVIVKVDDIKEDDVAIDPAQDRIPKVLDATRRNSITRNTKNIAEDYAQADKKKAQLDPAKLQALLNQEFPEESWRDPAAVQKVVMERFIQRLGDLSHDRIWDFIKHDANRRDLAILQMIRLAGVDTMQSIAKKHTGRLMLARLSSDLDWLTGLLYSGPTDNFGDALTNLAYIFTSYNELIDDPMAHKIATAGSLEFARTSRHPQLLLDRFTYYYTSYHAQQLNVLFEELEYWDMRLVAGAYGEKPGDWGCPENLAWMRDNVRLPAQDYAGKAIQVPYRLRNVAGDSIFNKDYLLCFMNHFGGIKALAHREVGGVCGALSHYGAYAAIAAGIPATTMGEPGHCAYVVRVGKEWKCANTIYWQRKLHMNFWKEPAIDYLYLAQNLYGDKYPTLVSDQMQAMGDILASQRKMLGAFYCYENAIVGQPLNWSALLRYNAYLHEKAPDFKDKWKEFHERILEGMNSIHHNVASRLLSKYIYPNMLPMYTDTKERTKLFASFFDGCETMGLNRWDVEPLLTAQLATFESDEDKADYMKEVLKSLIVNVEYSGAGVTWALNYIDKLPDKPEDEGLRKDLADVIVTALSRARTMYNQEDATWVALGEASWAAAENGDRYLFNAIGVLAYRKFKRDFPKVDIKYRAIPGTLISGNALIHTDKTINPDGSCNFHWACLQKDGGKMPTKNVVTVELEKMAEINGVAVVTGKPLDMQNDYQISVSDDGKKWKEIASGKPEGTVFRVDVRKDEITGKYLQFSAISPTKQTIKIVEDIAGFYVHGRFIK